MLLHPCMLTYNMTNDGRVERLGRRNTRGHERASKSPSIRSLHKTLSCSCPFHRHLDLILLDGVISVSITTSNLLPLAKAQRGALPNPTFPIHVQILRLANSNLRLIFRWETWETMISATVIRIPYYFVLCRVQRAQTVERFVLSRYTLHFLMPFLVIIMVCRYVKIVLSKDYLDSRKRHTSTNTRI